MTPFMRLVARAICSQKESKIVSQEASSEKNLYIDFLYLQDLDLKIKPSITLPTGSEIGVEIKGAGGENVDITPFVGRMEGDIWFLPANILSSEKISVRGLFLADKEAVAKYVRVVKIAYPKNYPALSVVWNKDKLEKVKFRGPGQGCGMLTTFYCDKYFFNFYSQSSMFRGKVNLRSRLLALHQVLVGFGKNAKKYQKLALIPYLTKTNNSENERLINACSFGDAGESLGKALLVYPQRKEPLKEVVPLLRHYDPESGRRNVINENRFYSGDYVFYGIKDYRGLLWTELEVPSQSRSYKLSLKRENSEEEQGRVIIQARSLVGDEFTDWSTLGAGANSFDIAAGTEKVQLRVFFQGDSPDLFGSLESVELASGGSGGGGVIQVPQPGDQSSGTESGILGGRNLISTGTHLLLLLIISVILIVSIVYIVALIREE